MHICDESMNLLIGSKMSVGTLKSIADLVHKNGPDMMPGYCVSDNLCIHSYLVISKVHLIFVL